LTGCGSDSGENYSGDKVKSKTVAAKGSYHSFIFSNNGSIYATGLNDSGQLGLGDNAKRNVFTEVTDLRDKNIISIAVGQAHSFAFSDNGTIYAAGYNEYGQLGFGDNVDRNVFTEVTDLRDKNITSIVLGCWHSVALSDSGRVYVTGLNNLVQLGLGDNVNRNVFTEITDLRDKNITSVVAGDAFTLAVSNNGRIYAMGRNKDGQLGLGDNVDRNTSVEITSLRDKNITSIVAGRWHSFVFFDNGSIYATGQNQFGELGLGDNVSRNVFTEVTGLRDKNIISIVGDNEYSFALGKDGKVYSTGWNNYGQLGLGDNVNRNVFTEVIDLRDKNITSIILGDAHSLAFSSNGKIYATGRNSDGQLSLGDNNNRNTFVEVTIP
jgi:alpha-tubulin suppressor-like RCC1 family protein